MAVGDDASHRRHRHHGDPVGLGLQRQLVVAHDLQPQQPRNHEREARQHQAGGHQQAHAQALELALRVVEDRHAGQRQGRDGMAI